MLPRSLRLNPASRPPWPKCDALLGRAGQGEQAEIPKNKILELLRQRGDHQKADEADQELSDQVDADRDAGLLSKLGIDPMQLVKSLGGGGGGLGGLLGR